MANEWAAIKFSVIIPNAPSNRTNLPFPYLGFRSAHFTTPLWKRPPAINPAFSL